MAPPFSLNVFSSVMPNDSFNEVVEALEQNRNFAFEFQPFGAEKEFNDDLATKLSELGFIVFKIDVGMVTGLWHFAIEFTKTLTDAIKEPSKKADMVKRLAVAGPVRVGRTNNGELTLDVPSRSDLARFVSTLFDIPEITGIEENKRSVTLISGFERLHKILGSKVMKIFYEKAGRHAVNSYIISGRGMKLFAKKMEGKISNQVEVKNIMEVIAKESLKNYLKDEFEKTGFNLTNDLAESIYQATSGRLEPMLKLSSALLKSASRGDELNDSLINKVIDDIVGLSSFGYSALWRILNSRQKSMLFGLTFKEDISIYSEDFITKYGFGTATNLQAALRGLNTKSIIVKDDGRWDFADPFLKLWIRQKPAD